MHSEVIVSLAPDQEFRCDLAHLQPMGSEEARKWLDDAFVQLECEPLRPSGKVLLADKVLVVAQAAGVSQLSDSEWLQTFARATVGALSRPLVRVDVPTMTISF